MTDKPRNWQEDMKLCQKATRGPWMGFDDSDGHCIGTKDIHPQLKAHAPVVTLATSIRGKSIYISQNDSDFIIASREALPYWLLQVMKLEKELEESELVNWMRECKMATERHAAVSRDRDAVYKKLEEAESLIQQKDTEIAAAEKAYEGLQANCVSRGEYEATLKKLDDMTKAYHALLKEVGDTP